jgi:hypothetical protein
MNFNAIRQSVWVRLSQNDRNGSNLRLMHDPWATGTLAGQYTLGIAGITAEALRKSATGSASVKRTAAPAARHVAKVSPLTFTSFEGNVAFSGRLCQDCNLKTAAKFVGEWNFRVRPISDLRLERASGPSYSVSGPLDNPIIEPLPAQPAQAKLR